MTEATPVPEDFHTITPHLVVRDAAQAVAFYTRALGRRRALPQPRARRTLDRA
jgi:hypothetical protein